MHTGFIRAHHSSFATLYRLSDAVVIVLSLLLALHSRGLSNSAAWALPALGAILLFSLCAEALFIYRSWRTVYIRFLLGKTVVAWLLACTGVLMVLYFLKVGADYSRLVMGSWMTLALLALLGSRLAVRALIAFMRRQGFNTQYAAVVGVSPAALKLVHNLETNSRLGIKFVGYFDDRKIERLPAAAQAHYQGTVADLIALARNNDVDKIYIALPLSAQKRIEDILQQCSDTTASVEIIPNFFTFTLLRGELHHVGDVQTLSVFDTPISGLHVFTKRMEDLVLSSLILALITIPMLLIAIGIKLTSPGPVLFKQRRYGIDGKSIKVYKFRTMKRHDNAINILQATKNDYRVTPFGAFLRQTSLDELPQFINVLQGRMAIVGPRPHANAHNEEYRKLVPGYMLRHMVRPGITGWAQINGWRGETDSLAKMEKRIEFDLHYIRHWSLWLDIKIVFMTLYKGFVHKNAY